MAGELDEERPDELGEGDLEEQLFKDEYEDSQHENTAPTTKDPGITVKKYLCSRCGKTMREVVRLIPPAHCGVPMREVTEYGQDSSFPEIVLEKSSAGKARAAKPALGRKKGKSRA